MTLSRYMAVGVLALLCAAATSVGEPEKPNAPKPKPGAQDAAKIVLPDWRVLGQPVGKTPALAPAAPNGAVYPVQLSFDLDGSKVYGLTATYPEEAEFKTLADAVDLVQKKWSRDKDGGMRQFGVTVWRNEEGRFATQVSENQVIMVWLDRRVTDREADEVADAIVEGTVADALKAVEPENKEASPAADGE